MKIVKIACTLFLMGGLTACTTGNHIYGPNGACLTCINNPVTGEALNYDSSANEKPSANGGSTGTGKYISDEFVMKSDLDVDSAYAAMRLSFGFRSEQEMSSSYSGKWGMKSKAWRHEAVPGSFYNLSDYARLSVSGHPKPASFILSAKIAKRGSGSIVSVGYESNSGVDKSTFDAALKRRLERTLM